MANIMRWRYGDTQPVKRKVDAATVIEIGDLLFRVGDVVRPMSQADNDYLFAGVAMQSSRNGDTEPIRVATSGVFEYDCLSTTFEVGDLIGERDDQIVGAVDAFAIGRCAKRVNPAGTKVLVEIAPKRN